MVSLTNVSFEYNSINILRDVNLNILPGDFVYLVGRTGSGKSTLLKLIYMDLFPVAGEVTVGPFSSKSINRNKIPALRKTLGIIFQDIRLLEDRNVYENVAFALHVTGTKRKSIKQKTLKALADVGLSHKRKSMPHELSGGEQQRAALARALVNEPWLLIADEPTGNLDPATSGEILKLLIKINTRGTAILMATHNYEIVRNTPSARALLLRDGDIIEVEARRQG